MLPEHVVFHDHRRTGIGRIEGATEYIASVAALFEQIQHFDSETLYWVGIEPHASLAVARTAGTLVVGGGEFESIFVRLVHHDAGGIRAIELYELDDLARAGRASRSCGLGLRDRDVPRLRAHALEPGAHRGVGREVELPLVRHVRVRVERDVRDRVALADEEAPAREVRLHHAERRVAALDLVGELRAVRLDQAEVVPGAHHRDVRLVAVLLEEQPLQHLRAAELVVRQERRALGEVELDRVRLPQVGAVLEPDAGDAPVRVLRQELGGARLALRAHDLDLHQLVGDAELGQEQAHLVAVARRPERRRVATCESEYRAGPRGSNEDFSRLAIEFLV